MKSHQYQFVNHNAQMKKFLLNLHNYDPTENKDSVIVILLFSSMTFITPPSDAVYMIIHYLLFRRERVLYKMDDFNCLINKTWLNALVK